MNVMDKAERIANAISYKVPLTFDKWREVRDIVILELGEIKKEESQGTAIPKDSSN
ncbi:hypothetical protein C8E03_108110 [Lachnotalea glycerini]|uniref:Uncharacterized protein n=1 Tax=Lachnotalea glycerini TaxID=1763509 RepID=A0A318EPT7_9FIRM|nr:hypothetical protein [Lachnotalea glycerini]PXV88383.1 hypothetical protein C8E03_108110 [Lachnotalea glycerini]